MSVATVHPQYAAMLQTWDALLDAFDGSAAVKGAMSPGRAGRTSAVTGTRYLPRPPGMVLDEQYQMYLARSSWGDFTAIVVNGITGAVFRREPVITVPAALEAQLADVTQTGVPLEAFAEEWMRQELLLHRYGVLIDYPQPPLTEAGGQLPPITPRPYWIPYPVKEILNWRTIQRQGDTLLSLVVLKECLQVPQGLWPSPDYFVVQDQVQYRVLRLNELGFYEVSLWVEQPVARGRRPDPAQLVATWIPLREGEPLDFIPFVFDTEVRKSLLEGLVEVNYRYYRHSADYEQALFLTASPTPWVCSSALEPQTQLLIGSNVAWVIPDSTASVGMLQPDAAGLPAHQIALDTDKKDMAALGARLLERPADVTETRIAANSRTQGAESPIQSLITTVSRRLTQALQIHAWWAGVTDNIDDPAVSMALNKDIVANEMPPQLLTSLMQALLNGTISRKTFYYNLQQGEVARPNVDYEEEQGDIELDQLSQPLVTPAPASPPPPAATNGATRPAA